MLTPQQIALEAARQQFKAWRAVKKHSGERIPDALWALVTPLIALYKSAVLARHLGLSSGQLKKKYSTVISGKKINKDPLGFIDVPLTPFFQSVSHASLAQPTLTFERANGAKLSVFNWPTDSLLKLVNEFIG